MRSLIPFLLVWLPFASQSQDSSGSQNDSLVHCRTRAWVKPVMVAGYAGATYLCYRYLDTRIKNEVQSNKNGFEDFVFGKVSDLGLGRTQTISLGLATITAFALKNNKLKKTVIIWAGSLFINSFITDQLKTTFQRHRPNTGDPYNVFDWRQGSGFHRSFPSGHTSNAFTTATVWATQYKDHKWVPVVAYGLASLVGLSRIYHNAHWASDVMTGAAVGFASAKMMNGLYKIAGKKIHFLPQVSAHYTSVSLVCQL